MTGYGYSVEVADGYDEAVIKARLAFRGEGFSILSEMHVGGMLGAEAGAERQYLIMGVWNSALGDREVEGADNMRVAVHLPCNLVVQETGPTAVVAAFDPEDVIDPGDAPAGVPVAAVRDALQRVLARVGALAA